LEVIWLELEVFCLEPEIIQNKKEESHMRLLFFL
jgi:hypothetical protein